MSCVVAVFVGHKNRIDVLNLQVTALQTFFQFAQAQSTIDQHTATGQAAVRFYQGGIARTATAQIFDEQSQAVLFQFF